jgi:RNA polymerase sigma factor (sigma-70 family)
MSGNQEIDLFNHRDNTVIEKLYTELFPPMLSFCLNLVGNKKAAEDATQEAFINLWTASHEQFDTIQGIKNYLFILVRNKSADIRRKNKLHKEKLRQLSYSNDFEDPTILSAWQQTETINELRDAINRLPPGEAEVIKLFYHDGIKAAQIADMLQISLRTVYRRLQSATNKLRKTMKNKWVIITVILMLSNIYAVLPPKKTFKNLAVFIHQFVFTMGRSKTK